MWHAWEINAYKILFGKPKGKRPHGRPTHRWRNMVGGSGLDASDSGQGPVAGSYEHSNEPFDSVKGGEYLD